MPKPTIYYVIDPRGEAHTRRSPRRYEYAVLIRAKNEALILSAARCASSLRGQASNYRATVNAPNPLKAAGHLVLPGETLDKLVARYARYADSSEEQAKEYDALAEERRRIHGRGEQIDPLWGVAGWCGRLDLAQKLEAFHRKDHHTLILEARLKD